jgi:hypothetical protein
MAQIPRPPDRSIILLSRVFTVFASSTAPGRCADASRAASKRRRRRALSRIRWSEMLVFDNGRLKQATY